MIEALTFNISDRPFVPGIENEQFPPPLVGNHYFADLLHPWLDSKYLGGNFYFGLTEVLSLILDRFNSYPYIFALYLASIGAAVVVSIVLLRVHFDTGLWRLAAVVLVVSLGSWPNIFAISRGQISLPINIITVSGFLIILQSKLRFTFTNPRASKLLAIAIGAALSIKIFGLFALISVGYLGLKKGIRESVLPLIVCAILVLLPGTYKSTGFLYVVQSSDLYSGLEYYEQTRNYNFSLQTLFIDSFGPTALGYTTLSAMLSVVLSAGLSLLAILQYQIEEKSNRSHISSAFVFSSLLGLALPIAAPYVLAVYLLPLIIAITTPRYEGDFKTEAIGRFNKFTNYYALTISIITVSPSQIRLEAFGGRFLGASLYPSLVSVGLIMIIYNLLASLIAAKRNY